MRWTTPLLLASIMSARAVAAPPAQGRPSEPPAATTQPSAKPEFALRDPYVQPTPPGDAARKAFVRLVRDCPVAVPGMDEQKTWPTPESAAAYAAWLKKAGRDVFGFGDTRPMPAGTVVTGRDQSRLYLHVLWPHDSGTVVVYGLPGDQVSAAWLIGDRTKHLAVQATPRDTIIELTAKGKPLPDPIDTVVGLDLKRPTDFVSLSQRQAEDGSVLLHAKDAIVYGTVLRYEPDPKKNTLGYWTNADDMPAWDFQVDKGGDFEIELLQGCGPGNGGSVVAVAVDSAPDGAQRSPGQPLKMTVQDTGHFQNFVARQIGRVTLKAGAYRLSVQVENKKGKAVMDLRQVVLRPATGGK